MSRLVVLLVIIALIVGALVFLSSLPKQQPTKSIEVPVAQGGNAH